MNIQHPTFNAQHPIVSDERPVISFYWMSMFSPFPQLSTFNHKQKKYE